MSDEHILLISIDLFCLYIYIYTYFAYIYMHEVKWEHIPPICYHSSRPPSGRCFPEATPGRVPKTKRLMTRKLIFFQIKSYIEVQYQS